VIAGVKREMEGSFDTIKIDGLGKHHRPLGKGKRVIAFDGTSTRVYPGDRSQLEIPIRSSLFRQRRARSGARSPSTRRAAWRR